MALFFVVQVLGFDFGILVSYEQSLVVGCWMSVHENGILVAQFMFCFMVAKVANKCLCQRAAHIASPVPFRFLVFSSC